MKKPAYVLFIGLAPSFDYVDRELIYKTVCLLRLTPISNMKLIELMESLYSNIRITLAQTLDDDFELLMDVR